MVPTDTVLRARRPAAIAAALALMFTVMAGGSQEAVAVEPHAAVDGEPGVGHAIVATGMRFDDHVLWVTLMEGTFVLDGERYFVPIGGSARSFEVAIDPDTLEVEWGHGELCLMRRSPIGECLGADVHLVTDTDDWPQTTGSLTRSPLGIGAYELWELNFSIKFLVQGEVFPYDNVWMTFNVSTVGASGGWPQTTGPTTASEGTYTQVEGQKSWEADDPVPFVDIEPAGTERPSAECGDQGGSRVIDSTTQGVHSVLYTHQPSAGEVWLCARADDTGSGDGYGGRLKVSPNGAVPPSGTPGVPAVDEEAEACSTTTEPPNQIPGSHPISSGGIGPVDYLIDAYDDGAEAWLCFQVNSTGVRVKVPYGDEGPGGVGTAVTWEPDPGTPPE